MKLNKELFTELNKAKKKADAHAMHIDLAIQCLQNLCEHKYESDSLAGQYEQPSCKICGFEFKPVQNGIQLNYIVIDEFKPDIAIEIESQFEFLFEDKSWNFNFGQSPRGINYKGHRPNLLNIKYQNIRLDKIGLSKYIEYLTVLHSAME